MSQFSSQLPSRPNSALFVLGLIAGGAAAAFSDGAVPPAAVAAATFALLALRKWDGAPL